MLSDSPPDRDVIWTEEGVQGAWRFVQRLWRLVGEIAKIQVPAARPQNFGEPAIKVRKAAHRALAHVSEDIDKLRFNRCVAHIYEFANSFGDAIGNIEKAPDDGLSWSLREAGNILVQLFHPMMPHLAEECWAALGHKTLVATEDSAGPNKWQKTGRSDRQSQRLEQRDRGCRSRPRCCKKGTGGPEPEKGHCRPAKDRQCRGLIPDVSLGHLLPWCSPG
jgi:leucyl-tRNA synthetase